MSHRAAWLLCALLLVASHVGYHAAGREPGVAALSIRLVLVVLLFVIGSAARRARRGKAR
jgi:hypothetical protein